MEQEVDRWITWRGRHIPVGKDGKIINYNKEVSHYTRKQNYESIIKQGFDLQKVGSGAGSNFGKGIYFTNKENEKAFYKNRLTYEKEEAKEIIADVNTEGFLKVEYNDYVKSRKDMYNKIADKLTKDERKKYKNTLKEIKEKNKIAELNNDSSNYNFNPEKDAIVSILENNYPGIIIEQDTPALDIITGGNQVVVYNTKRINIRR